MDEGPIEVVNMSGAAAAEMCEPEIVGAPCVCPASFHEMERRQSKPWCEGDCFVSIHFWVPRFMVTRSLSIFV